MLAHRSGNIDEFNVLIKAMQDDPDDEAATAPEEDNSRSESEPEKD